MWNPALLKTTADRSSFSDLFIPGQKLCARESFKVTHDADPSAWQCFCYQLMEFVFFEEKKTQHVFTLKQSEQCF